MFEAINVVEMLYETLMTGLWLAAVGMVFVFGALFLIEILVRIVGKVFGPKASPEVEVSQSPPASETKEGG
jgi:Na+-transporting methylmalonyl-CoA/oxaloacetate decarboxylase gamma subunit